MELTETIAFIRRYNAWRRGHQGIEQPQPYKIGQALDSLCNHAERLERERNDERQRADRMAAWLVDYLHKLDWVYDATCNGPDCEFVRGIKTALGETEP